MRQCVTPDVTMRVVCPNFVSQLAISGVAVGSRMVPCLP